ncbi:hypothetical protein lerEdw1_020645 [Lerista edwardsae]|nr:hypothetical protein lerEdw1_020645 [Lerista edwardsae]
MFVFNRKKNRETHNAACCQSVGLPSPDTYHVLCSLVERHRKKKINAGISRIGELIPCSPALKQASGP